MKVHFLGTTGYHPNNRRHTACLMIPELGVIFDAGTGIFRARDLLQTKTLDIFMSHVHLDHSVGLTFLLDVLFQKDVEKVRVHMAEEKISAVQEHLYHSLLFPVKPEYEFCPLTEDGSVQLADGVSLRAFPLDHPGGSHGFVLKHGEKRLAYVTDTTAAGDADYLKQIQDVDLLIHECYFPDGLEDYAKLTGHSCLTPVARVAKQVNAKRLILVHINPLDESDEPLNLKSVSEIYSNVQVAEDHLEVDL
jgi:ribonuclease BN (tRNA processing enzyme)